MYRKISLLLVIMLLMMSVSFAFADESYYVQSGAFQYKSNAESYVNYLESIGYDAVVIKVHSYYKVFLGPYSSETKAREIQKSFLESGGSGFLVLGSEMYDVVEPVIKKPIPTKPKDTTTDTTTDDSTDATDDSTDATDDSTDATTDDSTDVTTDEATDTTLDDKESDQPDVVDAKDLEKDNTGDKQDYKLFTIIFIMVLWLLFILIVMAFRFNQNRKK